jgi:hypothetical protein
MQVLLIFTKSPGALFRRKYRGRDCRFNLAQEFIFRGAEN